MISRRRVWYCRSISSRRGGLVVVLIVVVGVLL